MNLERYALEVGPNLTVFGFTSVGRKGKIVKIVQFQETDNPSVYNLAFGDRNPATGEFDDQVVTDNGDSGKVLATIVAALYAFTEQYPDKWVYATGSTRSRTRFYQMGINKYFDIAEADFDIMGERQEEWERYERNRSYDAFAVHLKTRKL